ncbi:secreted protein [marine sediment metagenome]|uniref:Secreted protein n=1 Tax=marine sediment metagenome TaxID=412755 RepID=A0A1B6NS18_9ZZZZ
MLSFLTTSCSLAAKSLLMLARFASSMINLAKGAVR